MLFKAIVLWGLLLPGMAWAVAVPNLYETEVIAESPSPEDKNFAVRAALEIVIRRIVAGDQAFQEPAVMNALEDAGRYVKQQQFALEETGFGNNPNARTLRVLFDEVALLNLLKTTKLRLWEENRPETLLWLVVEEDGQRTLFKPEAMYNLNNVVKTLSRQTGLPLLLPLQDLEEQRQISINEILSAYPERLLKVSERYGVVSILAGRLLREDECWKSDWSLYFDNHIIQSESRCTTLNGAVLTGLRSAYERLSSYYAVKPYAIDPHSVELLVTQVKNLAENDRILEYLRSLPMVKSVVWRGAERDKYRYEVHFNNERSALEDILGLGRVLDPQPDSNGNRNELNYRLLPQRAN